MKIFGIFMFLAIFMGLHEDTEAVLKKLIVMFRHGYRYPTQNNYKDITACTSKYTPDIMGTLTEKGKMQMKSFGVLLRTRYGNLLKPCCDRVQMCHTGYIRTKDSATLVLKEACPNGNKFYHNMSTLPENLAGPVVKNETYQREWMNTLLPLKYYNELMQTCKEHAILECNDNYQVNLLADQIITEAQNYCPLPSWLNNTVTDHTFAYIKDYFSKYSCGQENRFIYENTDYLVQFVISVLKSRKENTTDKTYLLAMNDLNIAMVLSRIGMFNNEMVPFGAGIAIELHRITEKPLVRTFYINSTDYSVMYQMKVPNCEWDCPVEQFVANAMKPFVQCRNLTEFRAVQL